MADTHEVSKDEFFSMQEESNGGCRSGGLTVQQKWEKLMPSVTNTAIVDRLDPTAFVFQPLFPPVQSELQSFVRALFFEWTADAQCNSAFGDSETDDDDDGSTSDDDENAIQPQSNIIGGVHKEGGAMASLFPWAHRPMLLPPPPPPPPPSSPPPPVAAATSPPLSLVSVLLASPQVPPAPTTSDAPPFPSPLNSLAAADSLELSHNQKGNAGDDHHQPSMAPPTVTPSPRIWNDDSDNAMWKEDPIVSSSTTTATWVEGISNPGPVAPAPVANSSGDDKPSAATHSEQAVSPVLVPEPVLQQPVPESPAVLVETAAAPAPKQQEPETVAVAAAVVVPEPEPKRLSIEAMRAFIAKHGKKHRVPLPRRQAAGHDQLVETRYHQLQAKLAPTIASAFSSASSSSSPS